MEISWGSEHHSDREASMSQNIVSVGIDVDDVRYRGCALNQHTGETLDLAERGRTTAIH